MLSADVEIGENFDVQTNGMSSKSSVYVQGGGVTGEVKVQDGERCKKRRRIHCETVKVMNHVCGLGKFLQSLPEEGELFGRPPPWGGSECAGQQFTKTIQYYCRKSKRVMGNEAG